MGGSTKCCSTNSGFWGVQGKVMTPACKESTDAVSETQYPMLGGDSRAAHLVQHDVYAAWAC